MNNIGATLLKIGALAFIFGIFFFMFGRSALGNVSFYFNSTETEAKVTQIHTSQTYCHKVREEILGSNAQPCTLFKAEVQYQTPNGLMTTKIDSGSAVGHSQPAEKAGLQPGDTITILYDTRNPALAHPKTATNYYMWALAALPVLFGVFVFIAPRTEANYSAN